MLIVVFLVDLDTGAHDGSTGGARLVAGRLGAGIPQIMKIRTVPITRPRTRPVF